MCLYIKKEKHKRKDQEGVPYPLVSKTNKVTYKMLRNDCGRLKSPHRGTETNTFEIMSAPKFGFSTRRYDHYEINAGIHSYATLNKAYSSSWGTAVIVKCIIPAGTPYYIGTKGDIVSLILMLGPTVGPDKKEVTVPGRFEG